VTFTSNGSHLHSLNDISYIYVSVAVACLDKTISFLLEKGRFRQAADRKKEIGQIFQETDSLSDAITAFKEAGDWYSQEDAQAYVLMTSPFPQFLPPFIRS
jgi:hypothetical protein